MIAFLEARKAGLFRRGETWRNVVAGVATSILGGTRVQISGPTGAFIAVLAGVTAQYGIAGLQVATLMAGVMLLAMGFLQLGAVIRFIPNPVIVGFTTGIAVIIFVGQWTYFFGLPPVATGEHFHERFWALVQALPGLHGATTGIALLALALVVAGNRVLDRLPGLNRVPAPLVAMLAATAVQAVWQFPGVATIGSTFGGIPRSLPAFHWPAISLTDVIQLVGPAFTIALLGAIESLLTAVVADGMTGTRHNPNQELIGQGAANMLAPVFGGFAATGAIARTATNIRNGATSPLAGIVHSAFLVLVINVGVVLAALLFMRRMAESVSVQQEVFGGPEPRANAPELPAGAAEKLETTVERAQLHVDTVVIRLGRVPFMDATGMHTLSEIIERFQRRGIRVMLVEIQERLRRALARADVINLAGPQNVFDDLASALRALQERPPSARR